MQGDADTIELERIVLPPPAEPAHHLEPEPTTLSIPLVTGAQPLVVDEPLDATRSLPALSLTPRRAKLALGALAACAFAFGVNEASVVAMSAPIAAGLGVPVATIGILATAFALTVVVAALPLAALARRFSRRHAVTAAVLVWTVGVAVAATATELWQLTAGRMVSASAHAMFWAIVAPTAASLFAPHLRGKTVTAIMLGSASAGVLGTPVVTFVGEAVSWRVPYFALAALGVVLAVAVAFTLPGVRGDSRGTPTRGDLPSGSAFARVLVVTFLAAVGMSATWTYIVPFYTDVSGLASGMLPLMFALGGLVAVAATLSVSSFLTRYPVHTVGVGAAILVVAWGLLAIGTTWSAILAQAVQSGGWAVLVAALLNWAMRHSPWATETGAGAYTVTMNAGAAVGPMLGAGIVATLGMAVLPWVSLGLTLAAVLVTARVDRKTVAALRVPRAVRLRQAARLREMSRLRAAQARAQRQTAFDLTDTAAMDILHQRVRKAPVRRPTTASATVKRQREEWLRRRTKATHS